MDSFGMKIMGLAIAIVGFGLIREIYLFLTIAKRKGSPSAQQSIVEEAFVMSAPKPLSFRMSQQNLVETQTIQERNHSENYAFIPYERQQDQTPLQAFDQLMTQLGPAHGRRLVIAEFEDQKKETGIPDVLRRKTDLKNIICREMWESTDLIPHAHVSDAAPFNKDQTKAFIDRLKSSYDEIVVFDKKEKRSEWTRFFDSATTSRASLYQSREI